MNTTSAGLCFLIADVSGGQHCGSAAGACDARIGDCSSSTTTLLLIQLLLLLGKQLECLGLSAHAEDRWCSRLLALACPSLCWVLNQHIGDLFVWE